MRLGLSAAMADYTVVRRFPDTDDYALIQVSPPLMSARTAYLTPFLGKKNKDGTSFRPLNEHRIKALEKYPKSVQDHVRQMTGRKTDSSSDMAASGRDTLESLHQSLLELQN